MANKRNWLCVSIISLQLMPYASIHRAAALTNHVSPSGLHVSPYDSWPNAATDIQSAVTAAVDDNTILISNGIYTVNREITVNKAVTLESVNGPTETTIDGNHPASSNRCIYLQHTRSALKGVTLTKGYATGAFPDDYGGAIRLNAGATMRECVVVSNHASGGGGGIYSVGGRILDSTIKDNSAPSSGGISCSTATVISNCVICGNIVTGEGGGIGSAFGNLIVDCLISNNHATWGGGGAYLNIGVGHDVLSRCTVVDNTISRQQGGGITMNGGTQTTLVENCIIRRNIAPLGGGIDIQPGAEVRGCVIAENVATNWGGGVLTHDQTVTMANCTIVSNRAVERGGGLYFGGGTIVNCIVYGNVAPDGTNYYEYYAASGGFYRCCTVPLPNHGAENITNAPLLGPAPTDHHLMASSPCIDSGTNLPWMATAEDIDRQVRIFNDLVDIGADETVVEAASLLHSSEMTSLWNTVIGSTCVLQQASALAPPDWTNCSCATTVTSSVTAFVITNVLSTRSYFRLNWMR